MKIDAHIHFWRLARGDNAALDPGMAAIYRDREPADLKPLLDAAGVDAIVIVQAAETLAETFYTAGLAARHGWIAGVVGWLDPASASVVEELDVLSSLNAVRGVRPVRDDNRSIAWMADEDTTPGWRALERSGLTLDILVQDWRELPVATVLAQTHPGLPVVLDHCAKPDIAGGQFDDWARLIGRFAALPNTACKLSGLLNCARPGAGAGDLRRYAEHVLDSFSPRRVMWASDWPPLDLAASYARWNGMSAELLAGLGAAEREAVLGGTARRFYRL